MKSIYEQDFQKRKPIRSKPLHKSNVTAQFTSPMILKTEYRDYYKPYTIREKTKKEKADEDLKKHLVNLPHVDRSHYSVTLFKKEFFML